MVWHAIWFLIGALVGGCAVALLVLYTAGELTREIRG